MVLLLCILKYIHFYVLYRRPTRGTAVFSYYRFANKEKVAWLPTENMYAEEHWRPNRSILLSTAAHGERLETTFIAVHSSSEKHRRHTKKKVTLQGSAARGPGLARQGRYPFPSCPSPPLLLCIPRPGASAPLPGPVPQPVKHKMQ